MATTLPNAPGTSIDPSFAFAAVTPSDTIPLSYNGYVRACKSIYVGSAGANLAIKDITGTATTFTAVPIGILYVQAAYIMSTNTTSTNIIALF